MNSIFIFAKFTIMDETEYNRKSICFYSTKHSQSILKSGPVIYNYQTQSIYLQI